MKIYRIALTKFCDESGEGAKRYGGRWNLPGYPALYGSNSVAAALLERLTIDSELFSSERYRLYSVMEFLCDDSLIYMPTLRELPEHWDSIPFTKASQQFGTDQLKQGKLCFVVPSVVDVSSLNAVVNPTSTLFSKIQWSVYPLTLDQRIVR
jgi:RES domain-containing protein